MIGLIGRKVGMTRVFTEDGVSIPVTVLKLKRTAFLRLNLLKLTATTQSR